MAKNTIKTVALIAGEVKEIEANRRNAIVRNNGSEIVYASSTNDVSAGVDGTMAISAGSSALVRDVGSASGGDNKLFMLANGGDTAVEVEFINDLNFKCEKKGGGGGGQPVDAYTKGEVDGFLSEKVGFTDWATSTRGGVVKTTSANGITISNGTLMTYPATSTNDYAGEGDIRKPITPRYLNLAMEQYGINSKSDIADMQDDIDRKFGAENFNSEQFTVENNVVSLAGGGGESVDITNDIVASKTSSYIQHTAWISGNIGIFHANISTYSVEVNFTFPFNIKYYLILSKIGDGYIRVLSNGATYTSTSSAKISGDILFFK